MFCLNYGRIMNFNDTGCKLDFNWITLTCIDVFLQHCIETLKE